MSFELWRSARSSWYRRGSQDGALRARPHQRPREERRRDRWLTEYTQAKDPWFCFSYGNGLYHHHRSWIDDPEPRRDDRLYTKRLQAGEDIARPREAVLAERDRITDEYRNLLAGQARDAFDEQLALARTVFSHIEDHNFYVDHWAHTLLWNKVREFGSLLTDHKFLADPEDVFFLRHNEARSALEELRLHWSSGAAGVHGAPPAGRRSSRGARRSTRPYAAGPHPPLGPGAGGRDRAGHDHALGDHHRARAGVASDLCDAATHTIRGIQAHLG